jgi:hypothetical protein
MASGDARKASSTGKTSSTGNASSTGNPSSTGRASSTGKRSGGRVTHKQPKAPPSSRYTPPIPREKRTSPPWYPWVLLSLFVAGLGIIVINYASIFWGATNWVLLVGLAAILIGTIMATRYH